MYMTLSRCVLRAMEQNVSITRFGAYLHEAIPSATAEPDHGADQLGVDLVEEEVEPGDVVVVDDVHAVLDPAERNERKAKLTY